MPFTAHLIPEKMNIYISYSNLHLQTTSYQASAGKPVSKIICIGLRAATPTDISIMKHNKNKERQGTN